MKAFHERKFWKRHTNPWSGWTRFAIFPALVYLSHVREWWWFLAAVIFLIVNPVLFPEPKHHKAWMSRGVLGEQLWMKKKPKIPMVTLLNILNGISFLALLYGIYAQIEGMSIAGTLGVIVFKMWFLNEMVKFYDHNQKSSKM